jgi:hypothetical protein
VRVKRGGPGSSGAPLRLPKRKPVAVSGLHRFARAAVIAKAQGRAVCPSSPTPKLRQLPTTTTRPHWPTRLL